eukprot:CAMPEP_0117527598 /NCGR_PEP_ID=MMETSP0784-20121206/36881_1 /TAXON_ID=39447 /ORGANISM="" /LENGTH=279 /DNA_ID=CAMNT_0005323857 /DNA_START=143 /DNA_END=979 /DNA_ORIENTATION=+
MSHLAKCGGTQVKGLLIASMTDADYSLGHLRNSTLSFHGNDSVLPYLNIENEYGLVKPSDLGDFILGSIRNPFDYYISLWAYTSQRCADCNFAKAIKEDKWDEVFSNETLRGNTSEDLQRFRKWLRLVSSEELGLLSLRFYAKYLDQDKNSILHFGSGNWQDDTSHKLKRRHPDLHERAIDVLSKFEHEDDGAVTCWVRTENVVEDTRHCLERYEKEGGPEGAIDWQAFDDAMSKTIKVKSSHVPCERFYDDDTRDLVLKGDAAIFRAFGFPEECDPPR